jgi:uncharacterized protein YndB with AHSA1/START domain
MASARRGEVSVHIDAPPDQVWSLVANLDRMGEWSPECHRVTWLDGGTSPASAGSRFKGHNRWGPVRWSMTCEVQSVEPGREISWSTTNRTRELVRWIYQFEPEDEGTKITESFEVKWLPPSARIFEDFVMIHRDFHRQQAMTATLQRIKAAAEDTRGVDTSDL